MSIFSFLFQTEGCSSWEQFFFEEAVAQVAAISHWVINQAIWPSSTFSFAVNNT